MGKPNSSEMLANICLTCCVTSEKIATSYSAVSTSYFGRSVSTSISGVPRNFVRGGGSTNSGEDRGKRERGAGGGSPLVRGSGGSCNLVQEISFHMVKFS